MSFAWPATIVHGQIIISEKEKLKDQKKDKVIIPYKNDTYPTRIFTPYVDLLLGFSTFSDFGFNSVGITSELRGGVQIQESLLMGTGISVYSIVDYEMMATVPFEMGYRTMNDKLDLMSSIGYSYLLYDSFFRNESEPVTGKTLAVDAYWRPTLSVKRLRFVLAAGVAMYDFGNISFSRCPGCGNATGPRYTFRLRAGLGF